MKVEQLNNVQIDWTKPQVVVSEYEKIQIGTNLEQVSCGTFSGIDIETGEFSNNWSKHLFKPENTTSYPIELKLTIESDEELCSLMHRWGIDSDLINDNTSICLKFKENNSDTVIFYLLDKLSRERNLYKND